MKQLKNYTEEAVRLYVDRCFKDEDICQCENCRLDVMAIMLNKLKSKYVVTEKGALFAQMDDFDPQYKIDLMTIMNDAVQIVKNSPRH
jgi:competence protein ComFB